MIEVKMPVYRITKRADDGSVLETTYVEDRWIPGFIAQPGRDVDGDPDLRLGTPDGFVSRRVKSTPEDAR